MDSAASNLSRQVMTGMTARDYLKILFRQKLVFISTIVSVTVLSWLILELSTPVYEAQVKMLIMAEKQVESPFFKDSTDNREIEASITQSEIVKSKPVLQQTVEALDLDQRPLDYEAQFASPLKRSLIHWMMKLQNGKRTGQKNSKSIAYRRALNHLKENIDVEPVRESHVFTITARDYDPGFAALLANSVSRAYVVFDLKQQLVDMKAKYTSKNLMVMQIDQNIAMMEKGLDGQPLPSDEAIGPASVKIIEQSTPPLEPVGLPKKLLWIVCILMSFPLAIVLAFTFQHMGQSFYSRQDIESVLGLPVIACINKKGGMEKAAPPVDVSDANKNPRNVSYCILAQQLLFMVKSKGRHTFLFLSTHLKDESSLTVASVAVFLSKRLGLKTLVVDANLRHPAQHTLFNVVPGTGLAQVLEKKVSLENALVSVGDKCDLLAAGTSEMDPSILLDTAHLKDIFEKCKKQYDVVLVDGPDVSMFRDACFISPVVDDVFLVVGENLVRKQTVCFFVDVLREAKCHIAGVVLANRNYLIPSKIYESL